jgi:gas vesicle protein
MNKFICGALMGAGVALLCAPSSGRTLRSRMRDKATGMTNDVTKTMESKSRHMANKIRGYRHKINEAMGNMTDKVRSTAETADREMAGMSADRM